MGRSSRECRGSARKAVVAGLLAATMAVGPVVSGICVSQADAAELHGPAMLTMKADGWGTDRLRIGQVRATVADDGVTRGGVKVSTCDAETGLAQSAGNATLEGATFEVTDATSGEVVATLTTDANGVAQSGDHGIPVGSYVVREKKAAAGYVADEAWSQDVTVSTEGVSVDVSHAETRVRSELKLEKRDGVTGQAMAGIPFLVTSTTTGESHVVVTDANGMLDTSGIGHSADTNANDAALQADGSVDESALVGDCGTWFYGNSAGAVLNQVPMDDSGALPYDTYTVKELRCEANAGRRLVDLGTVAVTEAGVLDLGWVGDTTVEVRSALSRADGSDSKCVPAAASTIIKDEVELSGVEDGHAYTLRGELHAIDASGTDLGVVAQASTPVVGDGTTATQPLAFQADTSALGGCKLVPIEYLYDGEDLVAAHGNVGGEDGAVWVPSMSETDSQPDHQLVAGRDGSVDEVVHLSGLVSGEYYVLDGSMLAVGDDGAPTGDAVLSGRTTFRATASELDASVTMVGDAPVPGGTTLVPRVTLSDAHGTQLTEMLATGDWVSVPAMSSSIDDGTGTQQAVVSAASQVHDAVKLSGLVPGASYQLTGTLHALGEDGTDAGEVKDANGQTISATQQVDAYAAGMEVSQGLVFDSRRLGGSSVFVVETLTRGGAVVATSNVGGTDDTVRVANVAGSLVARATGRHEAQVRNGESKTLTDTVSCTNLVPGAVYSVATELHYVDAKGNDLGAVRDVNGDIVGTSKSLLAKTVSGQVTLSLEVPGPKADGRTMYAVETITDSDGRLVATNAGSFEEERCVRFVNVSARAVDAADGDKQVVAGSTAKLTATLSYENLLPGQDYEVSGIIHVRDLDGGDAGILVDGAGNRFTAKTTFTPASSDGTVQLEIPFDGTGMDGREAMAYLTLSRDGHDIATTADATNDDATVRMRAVGNDGGTGANGSASPSGTGNGQKSSDGSARGASDGSATTGGSEASQDATGTMPNTSQGPLAAVLVAGGLTAAGVGVAKSRKKDGDED